MSGYKTHYLDNDWQCYYDRSLRLWVGLQYDSEDNILTQDNGEEAVYGVTFDELKSYLPEGYPKQEDVYPTTLVGDKT